MKKDLIEKAIDIKGRKYILVSDRVLFFNEEYPDGSITTSLVSEPSSDKIVVKATVTPESAKPRVFTGYSQAVVGEGYINKTAALENAETSAVGRALAFMGIGVIESIASVDEINKATSKGANDVDKEENRLMFIYENPKSEAQKNWAKMELKKIGRDLDNVEANFRHSETVSPSDEEIKATTQPF